MQKQVSKAGKSIVSDTTVLNCGTGLPNDGTRSSYLQGEANRRKSRHKASVFTKWNHFMGLDGHMASLVVEEDGVMG